jgi:hypothetical protein
MREREKECGESVIKRERECGRECERECGRECESAREHESRVEYL